MWFSTFVIKNIARRPLRALLTVIAIAIAIGSVEAFVGIASSFERSFLAHFEDAQIDLVVVRKGIKGVLGNLLDEDLAAHIRKVSGVKEVVPILEEKVNFPDLEVRGVGLLGWVPGTTIFNHLKFPDGSGRNLKPGDKGVILLGAIGARNLNKKVGDTLEVLDTPFKVVGIFESKTPVESGAVIMPVAEVQVLFGKEKQVSGFNIVLDKSNDKILIEDVRRRIEGLGRSITASPASEYVKTNFQITVAKGMAWVTSAIALIVGFFGMMNTMVMSVNERTREIGILRAVGWRVGRVMRMILLEAVLLAFVGAIIGTIGALILLGVLTQVPAVNGRIDGTMQPILILYGFLIALGVGLLGGLAPAGRAARMLPTQALWHE